MNTSAVRQPLSERAPIIKSTLADKAPLIDNTSKLGKRLELLEEQLLLNSQLGAKLQASFDEVLSISKKLGSKLLSVETSTVQTVNNLGEQISSVQRQIEHIVQMVTETKRSQEVGESSYVDIKGQLARALTFQQMRQISTQICEQINGSDIQLGKLFKEQATDMHKLLESTLQPVVNTQRDMQGSLAQFSADTKSRSLLEDAKHEELAQTTSDVKSQQLEIKAETDHAVQAIHLVLGKMQRKTHQDTPMLLGEIASVQKALQIPYASFKRSTTMKSDAGSLIKSDSLHLGMKRATTYGADVGRLKSDPDDDRSDRYSFKRASTLKVNVAERTSSKGKSRPEPESPMSPPFEPPVFKPAFDIEDVYDDQEAPVKFRDFSVQTNTASLKEHAIQTDPVKFDETHAKEKKKKKKELNDDNDSEQAAQKKKQTAFQGADKLKAQATAAAMKKPYSVFDYYWEEGTAQRIAKDKLFENVTLCIVALNSLWISIDLDLNKEALLLNAHPVFIIAENLFCLYFTSEVSFRFAAFQKKANCLKDAWFVFDIFLVAIMVIETWIIPIVFYAANLSLNASFFSMFRMLRLGRLLRLTRLTKLARSIPELLIIMKGLSYASRSVCMFFALWLTIIYVFAIVFQQVTDSTSVGSELFKTIPASMNTLLLNGVFGSQADIMHRITEGNPLAWPLIVFFMALVSLTIMYMLIGVMNECISVVATTEKNKIEVSWVVSQLREEVERLGYKEEDMQLSSSDLQTLSLHPGIIKIMQEAGVDVVVFADVLEMVFEDSAHSGQTHMTFEDFASLVLNTRGQNPATVKDTKEQIKVTKVIIKRSMDELERFLNKKFKKLQAEITALADDEDEDDDDE